MNELKIIEEFSTLHTPAVSDAIDELGVPSRILSREIRPMWQGARISGFARCVKLKPLDPGEKFDENSLLKYTGMLNQIKRGTVVVIDLDKSMAASGWGQVTSKIAQQYGCVGALVDGPIRDIIQIANLKFPVFAKGLHPASLRGRIKLGTLDEPVECGGQIIQKDDFIFGDLIGVIAISSEYLEAVLKKAKKLIKLDRWWIKELESGRSIVDLEKENPLP